MVYSRIVPKTNTKNKTKAKISKARNSETSSKKKKEVDSFAGILEENRFNIKEKGAVEIVSNGKSVTVR
jgi:hypothetical protein